MSKFKLFIENFLVYGIGGIISKIIPLIMVPVVTRLMPDSSYFGISDMSNTVVSFGSAIAVMGMYDAMYRMFFEKEDEKYKKTVCSTALMFTVGVSVFVFLLMFLCRNMIAQYFFGDRQYAYIVYISAMATLVGATNSIISAPTRMQNKRKIFLVTNTISPILAYSISIPMLLAGYYTVALPLASVVSGITMEISFGMLNRKWFSPKQFDVKLLKELLLIGIPLLPNFLIYWIFNSCDKVMITNMIGVGATGIYSVGSKLGHVSQLIYTAFAGGWQFFAFSTMKEENQVKTNSIIFEYLGIISFIATAFICAWSHWIFELLFTDEYLEGFVIAPYLFLAPLLQMLFQIAANQFLVIKKTWPNMFILSAGAAVNVVINYTLIPVLGIEGAAVATLIGYAVSDIVCVAVLCRMGQMEISGRFIASVLLIMVFIVLWRLEFLDNAFVGTVAAAMIMGIYMFIYQKEIRIVISKMKSKKGK